MSIEPEIISAFIGGAAGVLATLIANWFLRRKNNADAARAIQEAATALVDPLTRRIKALEDELEHLRPLPDLVKRLRAGIDILISQLRRLGQVPAWTPEDEPIRKDGRGG